jgi:hypothetical protein
VNRQQREELKGAGGVSDDDFGAAVDRSLAEDQAWWITEEIRTIEEESAA